MIFNILDHIHLLHDAIRTRIDRSIEFLRKKHCNTDIKIFNLILTINFFSSLICHISVVEIRWLIFSNIEIKK